MNVKRRFLICTMAVMLAMVLSACMKVESTGVIYSKEYYPESNLSGVTVMMYDNDKKEWTTFPLIPQEVSKQEFDAVKIGTPMQEGTQSGHWIVRRKNNTAAYVFIGVSCFTTGAIVNEVLHKRKVSHSN